MFYQKLHNMKLTTWSPRQVWYRHKAVDQIEKSPAYDDAIVYVEKEDNRHSGVAYPCKSNINQVYLLYMIVMFDKRKIVLTKKYLEV